MGCLLFHIRSFRPAAVRPPICMISFAEAFAVIVYCPFMSASWWVTFEWQFNLPELQSKSRNASSLIIILDVVSIGNGIVDHQLRNDEKDQKPPSHLRLFGAVAAGDHP